jgi:long-subunit fatty acid transport protein
MNGKIRGWLAAAALAGLATPAAAGGIDRSGQGLGPLFESGDYLEASYSHVAPHVKGIDLAGGSTGDAVGDHDLANLAAKFDLNGRLSLAMVLDQPYGAKLHYRSSSPLLGGTRVDEASHALLGLLRYRLDPALSVHGGLRLQESSATIELRGLAYGRVNGYRVRFAENLAASWVAGAAYEIPEIALRVAATYHGATRHTLSTTETGPAIDPDGAGPLPAMRLLDGSSHTRISTPAALNLDAQTGIAPDTLLFGQLRWVDWSEFRVDPARFVAVTGNGLIDLRDTRGYTLGLARRFAARWTGVLALNHEASRDGYNSPLSPVNGRRGITLAAIHTQGRLKVTAGISYMKLGDALLETGTPDTLRAKMSGNSLLGLGFKIGWAL